MIAMDPGRLLDEKLLRICCEGSAQELKTHLEAGLQGRINQSEELTGNTALHLATSNETAEEKEQTEKVKLLLDAGANPAAFNVRKETPVHCAARSGNAASLRLLLDAGGFNGFLSRARSRQINHNSNKSNSSVSFRIRRRSAVRIRNDSSEPENLLLAACDSECSEVVEVLLDEIVSARRSALGKYLSEAEEAGTLFGVGASSVCSSALGDTIGGLDIKEFLELPEPRQVVFFELGTDLAASNMSLEENELEIENSIYGRMLSKTPTAFKHLLDSCVYRGGGDSSRAKAKPKGRKQTTCSAYIDLFPFYNPAGSELNLLKAIIHYKRFELLTHPVCELFLYLKWRRARWLYWIMMVLDVVYCLLVLTYAILYYGQLGTFLTGKEGSRCERAADPVDDTTSKPPMDKVEQLNCQTKWLRIPVLISAVLMSMIQFAKLVQDRKAFFSKHFWSHRVDELYHLVIIVLIIVDQIPVEYVSLDVHKILAAFLVLCSCRIMVHAVARDPDTAMVVEMVTSIQNGLFKFFVSYIWLFLGWIVAFHITLGENEINKNGYPNSFHDIGSATAKVMAMFTGELGFETAFSSSTNLSRDTAYNFFIIVLFAGFIIEMCIILMNLLIGLAINDIQDLRVNADALRLMKEVVLQRYLESLLRIFSVPSILKRCCGDGDQKNLGQIVTESQFEGTAFYAIEQQQATDHSKLTVKLVELAPPEEKDTEVMTTTSSDGIEELAPRMRSVNADRLHTSACFALPGTVVSKLRPLMKRGRDKEESAKEDEGVKALLLELRAELEEVRRIVSEGMKK